MNGTFKISNARLLLFLCVLALSLFGCGGGENNNDPVNNAAPTANAGSDQTLVVGTLVSLDGSGSSDADGDSLTYTWSFASKPASSSAALSNPASSVPSFVADANGNYVLSLVVNDGELDSGPDTVTITILEPNTAPMANAGPDQTLVVGTLVSLDGSGSSDADGDSLTYTWSFASKPASSSAALSNPASSVPSFVADANGNYVLSLVVNDGEFDSIVDEITVISATGIEGIISSDRTLDLPNSPYLITDDIQIAYGATVSIDAGVEVIGNGRNIKVFGLLDVNGAENSLVRFNSVNIEPGNGPTNEWFQIDIDYLEVSSGSIYYPTGNAIYGSIILRNSILSDIPYLYLWYPVENCFIEKNIFINSGGISVGHSDNIKVYIRNNVFYQYEGDNGQEYAVKNWASYSTSETVVEYNSFLSTDRTALMLPGGYSSSKMTAINNYWNTSDTAVIEQMIYDKSDDLSSAGYIVYSPYLTSPHQDTPDVLSE